MTNTERIIFNTMKNYANETKITKLECIVKNTGSRIFVLVSFKRQHNTKE